MGGKVVLSEGRFFLNALWINLCKFIEKVVDCYNRIFTIKPDDAKDVYINLADNHRKKGELEEAVSLYNKVLDIDPNDTEALMKLGECCMEAGLYDEAIDALKRLTALEEPDHGLYTLGLAYFAVDKNDEALKAFKSAIKLNPGHAESHYKMGLIYDSRSDFDNAIKSYEKALSLNPALVKVYHSVGLAYEAKGQREEAVKYFKKAIEIEEKGGQPKAAAH